MSSRRIFVSLVLLFSIACGGPAPSNTAAPAAQPSAPAASPAPAAPAPSAEITPVEPGDGTSSGHVGTFRWSPVEGADGYRMRLNAATDGRLVWESPVVAKPEIELPATVGLEPEAHLWQITAMRGTTVLQTSRQFRFTVTP